MGKKGKSNFSKSLIIQWELPIRALKFCCYFSQAKAVFLDETAKTVPLELCRNLNVELMSFSGVRVNA